ncbi:Golgi membrane protein 1-like isoform X2 [Neocloeon triangulifer]|uniref:Golgi membrane protein 1-like isoform X2 n=1 Tax=Neocloeon triangulifer TaxID=2078957 RepID=UPI00286F089B|nr:Golgi membrane protein 1-like isoform X2 [Neocloeon triangulifer]
MGFESMRGTHGRCPPLLVGGLLVVTFVLTCNWWSSSTQSIELLKQLDELAEQLRRCNEERDQSIQLRLSVEGRLKSTEEELAQLRVRLEQQDVNADDTRKSLQEKDVEIKTLQNDAEGAKSAAKLCKTELESLKKVSQSQEEVIKSLKIEKDEMLKQKEERRKDVEKLKTELDKVTADLNNLKASQPAGVAANAGGPNLAAKAPPSGTNTKTKAADLNADEKDEDNAKEREDPINNNEAVDTADDERFDNKNANEEADNNNLPDENPVEDSVDQMAQAIQQENNNGGIGAIPAPAKS